MNKFDEEDDEINFVDKNDAIGRGVCSILVLLLIPVSIFLIPYVLTDIWNWFVVPLTDSLSVITYWHMFGLLLFIRFFRYKMTVKDEFEGVHPYIILKKYLFYFAYILVTWGIGYWVYSWTLYER